MARPMARVTVTVGDALLTITFLIVCVFAFSVMELVLWRIAHWAFTGRF